MTKLKGVSGFWLEIKALENARTHLVAELGAKDGMLAYGVWVRLFTWQYETASPIKDVDHVCRLTGLQKRTAAKIFQCLGQCLPQSLVQRSGKHYCKRTMKVLDNYNKTNNMPGQQVTTPPGGDSDSDSDYKSKNKYTPPIKPPPEPKPKPQRARFQRPDVSQVRAYCEERGNEVDAAAFVDHYESNGWKVGKNHMRDWKAAVRTWERTDRQRGNGNGRDRHETAHERNDRKLREWVDARKAGGVLGGDAGAVWPEVGAGVGAAASPGVGAGVKKPDA